MNQQALTSDTPQGEMLQISRKEYEALLVCKSDCQYLKYQLDQLKRLVFGTKSERYVPQGAPGVTQLSLFGTPVSEPLAPQMPKETISYEREKGQRKKPARQLLPAHLKRVDTVIEPENKPQNAREIGRLETEVLEYEPARLYVHRIIRPKYVVDQATIAVEAIVAQTMQANHPDLSDDALLTDDLSNGEEPASPILVAPMPGMPIPKCIAGAGLLAQICVSKFVDHLPFYRQVSMFKREKVPIAESTINGWFAAVCRLMEPLYNTLVKQILQSTYLQADESPLPVLDRDKPKATYRGYFWVYHAPESGLVCFNYNKSRGAQVCGDFLGTWQGALQTDGYAAYNQYRERQGTTLLACMAHARRKFEQAKDSAPAKARQMLAFFRQLYAIEEQARMDGLDHVQRGVLREQNAAVVFKGMKQWLDGELDKNLPKSALGMAISYTLNLWPRLQVYISDGRYEIDNNLIENKIRPVALGRKNYLFAGSHLAAGHNAMMYSFFACCKIADVNPFLWLKDVLIRIPEHKANKLVELLPHIWKRDRINHLI